MGRKHIALVQYASPDLVPANLRVMAAVNYSGGAPPNQLRQISSHWYNPGDAIPARYEKIGAVTYNWGDAIPSNLPILAAMEPDPSFWDAELLLNGGFETAGAGGADVFASWTESAGDGTIEITTTAGEFHSGTSACKMTSGPLANSGLSQIISVMPGRTYTITMWKRGDGTNSGRWSLWDQTNSAFIKTLGDGTIIGTEYQRITYAFRAPNGCLQVLLNLRGAAANGGVAYYDDISMKGAA